MEIRSIFLIILNLLFLVDVTLSKTTDDTRKSSNANVTPTDAISDDEIQKRMKKQGWSIWSEWSTCSRTCDGGVTYQLRTCHAQLSCKGEAIRYKICNMQPCPDQQDFRALQCAAYNELPYDGSLFAWEPHYDYSEPCALACRGRPSSQLSDDAETDGDDSNDSIYSTDDDPSVVVQLSDRVQDGTRCRPGSLDMCIQGKCQRVGCDLKIGSIKRIDSCGVCGGDGTTCTEPLYQWEMAEMSQCSVTCGGGYKMSMPSCQNRISGGEVEESLCNALTKPEPQIITCNTHLCPPKWIADEWGPCNKQCGGGKRQRTVICAEESGENKNRVPDEACSGIPPRIEELCNKHECPKWVTSQWSGCSVSCGIGVQIRSIECLNSQGPAIGCDPLMRSTNTQSCSTGIDCSTDTSETSTVAEEPSIELMSRDDPKVYHREFYSELPKPERLVDQKVPSEATFIQDTEWSPCTSTCGEGIRKRPYKCKIFLEFSRTVATLNDSLCHALKPPDEVERCFMEPCSLGYSGYGDEAYPRENYRGNHDGIKVQAAVPGKTYSWREEGYTSCSASCLGGVEELIINCVRDDTGKVVSPFLCSQDTKPENRIRTCNDIPCPPRWNYSDYTQCSKSCGIGIKTREVTCIHEVTRGGDNTMVVPSSMCPQPPPSDRQYCNVLDCPVEWEVGDWSKCTKACGGGYKDRKVACIQIMAQEHKVERPGRCPQPKPPEKKPCNTKPCVPEDQHPPILSSNTTFIQHDPKKTKITLKIGGAGTVFYGTQIKIKCPVKRYNRTKIRWSKDHISIKNNRKFKVSKKGALRVLDVNFRDAGVYTCHAGLSSSEIRLNVKAKPGEIVSSEEYERAHEDSDPKGHTLREFPQESTYLLPSGDQSHEQRDPKPNPPRSREKNKMRHKNPEDLKDPESSIMETEMTVSDSSSQQPPAYKSSSSRTMPMPHFQLLIASLQLLWPFQSFSHSRGHHLITSYMNRYNHFDQNDTPEEPIKPRPLTLKSGEMDDDTGGALKDISFQWSISEWSQCSQSCGANGGGYKLRSAHCIMKSKNSSQNVENSMCEDSGLPLPETVEKCGNIDCPRWEATEWSSCALSKCFAMHTALQKREVLCKFGNESNSTKCDEADMPVTKQECYSEKCKGTWRVEPWSDCNAACNSQGIKYRILQCVWYGTKKPAGNACKDQPRPAIMKVCKGPPCIINPSECRDISRYCKNVKSMGLCRLHRYQQQCCKSCRFNALNNN